MSDQATIKGLVFEEPHDMFRESLDDCIPSPLSCSMHAEVIIDYDYNLSLQPVIDNPGSGSYLVDSREYYPLPGRKTIFQKLREISAEVPPEEWEKLPRDLSLNHDKYLYGQKE